MRNHQSPAVAGLRAARTASYKLSTSSRIYGFAILLASILVIALPLYFIASAAAGDLDPTFGSGGKVHTSFPGGLDTANDVKVQSDGKVVVAGTSGTDFALTRYNTDGSLDTSFGTGGRVHTDFPVGLGGFAYALVIQPDGKLVLAGSASVSATSFESAFALARYNSDGTLDTSFDGDGLVKTAVSGTSLTARALIIQSDGKLVVGGSSVNSMTFQTVFALVRYNTNGSLDTSFDTDGIVTTDLPSFSADEIHALALQSDGKIVAGGLGNSAFALTRYNTNGSLDTSFDTDGIVTTPFGGTFEEVNGLAIQSDGKIVAAGQSATSTAADDNFALARYNTDGSLDTSFDTDGKVITDFGLVDAARDVVIQSDGKIVAAGSAGTIAGGSFFALARYNTNGSLDTSFDSDGKVTTDLGGGRFNLGALGVALQMDGKIVAAGDANITGQRDFGVARYNTNGSLDTTFDSDGTAITDFALNDDALTALLLQGDGKLVAVGLNNNRIRINQAQDPNFQLARYNSNGTLDTTFGTGGLVQTDFSANGDDFANAAALQADGKIVVAGQTGAHFSQLPSANTAFGVARYNTNGTLDTTFDTDGKVTTDFGAATHDTAYAVAIQADGKIVVGGTNGTDFALARYNTDGSLDTSFDMDGKVTTDFSGSFDDVRALVIQPDGKLVAAGSSANNFALARYNTDGSLDTSFDTDGKVTTDFFEGADGIRGLVIQSDGKLVAAGLAALPGGNGDFALARYNTNGSLDTTFDTDGKVTTNFGDLDEVEDLALDSSGKIVVAGYSLQNSSQPFSVFVLARYNTDGTLDGTFGTGGKVTTDFFGLDNEANAVVIQGDGKIVAGGYTDDGSSRDFALARYLGPTAEPTPTPTPSPSPSPSPSPTPATLQFSLANVTTPEGCHDVQVTLTRTGDTTTAVSVEYMTSDGTALQRTDYTILSGVVQFAAGETSKSFPLLVNDDKYVEGNESFSVSLLNPAGGAVLGSLSTSTITITDDDTVNPPASQPLEEPELFVCQHYHDFLSREADAEGFAYWTGEIKKCHVDPTCLNRRRVEVSNAFSYEAEFQQGGGYVIRLYRAAYGNNQPFPNPDNSNPTEAKKYPSYAAYVRDRAKVIGGAMLAQSQLALANNFVQRPEFLAKYPASLSGPDFVDALLATIKNDLGVDLTAQRTQLIAEFNTGGRGLVLHRLVNSSQGNPINNSALMTAEYNRTTVTSYYFNYLRRDGDIGGLQFWLTQISRFPIGSVAAQNAMVCSFVTSREYQERFSSVITHTNAECPQ